MLATAVLAVALSGCAMLEDLLGLGAEGGDLAMPADKPAPAEPEDIAADTMAPQEDGEADRVTPVDAGEIAPVLDLDLPGVTLVTARHGEGPRPVLRWEPVPDAANYLVVLRDGVEAPASWVWRGTNVEVQVGFGDRPGLGGPEVRPGMVWSVLAFDADDAPIAQSDERPIAP